MPRKLELLGPRQVALVPYEDGPLRPDQVRAQALCSGISHGTELNLYRGTAPFADRYFDERLRLFLPRSEPVAPMALGYEWVGRISEVGAHVQGLRPGDLVHMMLPHAETHTFVPEDVVYRGCIEPLPGRVSPDQAIFLALAGVALQAVHDARIKVGDRVAIFGMGAIGLLAVQLARLNGAEWIDAVDPIASRRSLAQHLGADRALDPAVSDVGYEIKTTGSGVGADVAIEVSGHYAALQEAIRCARQAGLVVAAGFYQGGGTDLRLGEEWHHNRITMVSSMAVWGCPHRDYPLWDRARIHQKVTDLLATGELRTGGLISHRVPFAEAARAYQLIDSRPQDVVKVVLVY